MIGYEDGYRHSKWLSFMSERIVAAKELLSEKGVLFISIDENEYCQLKLLCDDVLESKIILQHLYVKQSL